MTISTAERNVIVDGLLSISGENAQVAGRFLSFLVTYAPGIPWTTLLRTRAASWAPFVASRLSISAWCDEVVRYAT